MQPRHTLGTVNDKHLQIHLALPVHEKFTEALFERVRGWLVRELRARGPAAVVQLRTDKPRGDHWS